MTWSRATSTRTMYIRRLNAMSLCVPVHTARAMVEQTVLLDSGAMENFVDEQTWKTMGIGRHTLLTPIKIRNVDGTENKRGLIMHFCWLWVKYNGKSKLQRFFLTSLG